MTTLADDFLADLQGDDGLDTAVKMEEENVQEFQVSSSSSLLHSPALQQVLSEIPKYEKKSGYSGNWFQFTETKDPEYDLIVEANDMAGKLEIEIRMIHGSLKDLYRKRFPELEHQVLHPLDYARVVQKLGNNIDKREELEDILPAANIISISMSASSSTGTELSPSELAEVYERCGLALELDTARQKILSYVESRMKVFAPNLTEIVGSEIAAKLIGTAGGLDKLSSLPSNITAQLGKNKKSLLGFSTSTKASHFGCGHHEAKTPAAFEEKACRLIANKCTLAARIDSSHSANLDGSSGRKLRCEIEKRLEKLQEPPPQRKEKPLPKPDDVQKKRRGGQRARKMKERYAMTELHKRAMRLPFGATPTEEYGNTMKGLGALGMEGSGVIRANVREEKGMKVKKRVDKKLNIKAGAQTVALPNGGFTTSVYAMTPGQNIELGAGKKDASGFASGTTSNYFSHTTGFGLVKKPSHS